MRKVAGCLITNNFYPCFTSEKLAETRLQKWNIKKDWDLLHLIENVRGIYANSISYPKSNTNPNAQLCFRTDEMTSFFDQVYRYQKIVMLRGSSKYYLLLTTTYKIFHLYR